MDRQVITSSKVTWMRSGVSHAVRAGDMVYVTGATPFHGDRQIAKGDFAAQLHQVMKNIIAILEEAGTGLDRAVKMNIALTDMDRYAEFDAIFKTYFEPGNYPARQTIESRRLAHPDFLVSIDCIACC
ncbi:RidA family protein [Roseomonas stagni]|uniref:RidA family protein n=1 Tax=Falsiroseomonas algicola TaxID=2716930 RepID=A0A6M1LJX1_9PROT|nr:MULTISPECIES: RidA family protein [Acetobacteraceae]NGM20259.1 RidA family protein [Falsiroseomonas algicola]